MTLTSVPLGLNWARRWTSINRGFSGTGLEGQVGGVETLDVSYLQLGLGFPDELDGSGVPDPWWRRGVFPRKTCCALADGFFTELEMEGGGGDDVDEIAGVDEAIGVGEAGDLVFGGGFAGIGIIGVKETR